MTPHNPTRPPHNRSRGAALLAAMLTVTLVATFAAAAMWQQWRAVEVETAERGRTQALWILTGALDWSRLILREDGRTSGADHLAEPWAVPLQEARLSTFLAAERNVAQVDDASTPVADAFISGQMTDLQSRLNVNSLVQGGKVLPEVQHQFERLFSQLGLPAAELQAMTAALLQAQSGEGTNDSAPLQPPSFSQLGWLGLQPTTLAQLAPHVTVLPGRTPINANTAGAEVLMAAVEGLDLGSAQKIIAARQTRHFRSLSDLTELLGQSIQVSADSVGIASSYFEVRGRLRLETATVDERSIVRKQGTTVTTLWRERGALDRPGAATAPQSAR